MYIEPYELDREAYKRGYSDYQDDYGFLAKNPYCYTTQHAQWASWNEGYYDAGFDD